MKKQNIMHIIKNNLWLLKIALNVDRIFLIQKFLYPAWNSFVVFFEHTYMIGFIIDSIQYERPFWQVAVFVITVFVVATTGTIIISRIIRLRSGPIATERINREIRFRLYEKAKSMDLAAYDNPEFFNEFIWAMNDSAERVYKIADTVGNLLGAIVGFTLAGGYVISQNPLGLVVALISLISIFLVSKTYNKLNFKLKEKMKPLERRRDYISRVLYLSDYAKEIRMGNLKDKLMKDFQSTMDKMEETAKNNTKKLAVYDFLMTYVFNTFLFDGVYMIYLLYLTLVKSAFGFGTMFILIRSIGGIRNALNRISRILPEFQEHSLNIDKIRHFLEKEVKVSSPDDKTSVPNDISSLILKNVSFSYNDIDMVLKNINIEIHKGDKIALVGYNGAGKSTLVKLLMRLYDPTDGDIIYNGENIRKFDLDEYRKNFGTVFQDYQLFATSIINNITTSDAVPDINRADQAIKDSGLVEKFNELKHGYNTLLTREYDENGIILSGGEAQKLAICRPLYYDKPLIILDEPSSALDPLAEYNLNNTILNADPDKTIIFISHRLSTTKMADRIYMLEDGELIEQGNHNELIRLNGKYAKMFKLQSEKYR